MRNHEIILKLDISGGVELSPNAQVALGEIDTRYGTDTLARNTSSGFNIGRVWLAREVGVVPDYPNSVSNVKVGGSPLNNTRRIANSEEDILHTRFHGLLGKWGSIFTIQAMKLVDGNLEPHDSIIRIWFDRTDVTVNGKTITDRDIILRSGVNGVIIAPINGEGRVAITHIEILSQINLNKHNLKDVEWTETIANPDGVFEFGIYEDILRVDFLSDPRIMMMLNRGDYAVQRPMLIDTSTGLTVLSDEFIFSNLEAKNASLTEYTFEFRSRIREAQSTIVNVIMPSGPQNMEWFCNSVFGLDGWFTKNLELSELKAITIRDGYIDAQFLWDAILLICELTRCNCSFRDGRYELWRVI